MTNALKFPAAQTGPAIVALDLSLTRTGYAATPALPFQPAPCGVFIPPPNMRGMQRVSWIVGEVMKVLQPLWHMAPLVVLEGYSFGSKGRAVFDIAELGGVVRYVLGDCPCKVVEIAPACLKKYATGKGNAPKEAVLVEAVKRLAYGGSDHNVSDAMWLREMALDHYGVIDSRVPKTHAAALAAVKWPAL